MVRKKAKMGRPPRHEGERLPKSRTFRVRPHLDELLMTAAAKAGRSVSEEIEYRLDRSFYEDALPARMAETLAPLVEQAARAGGEAALKVRLDPAGARRAQQLRIRLDFAQAKQFAEHLGVDEDRWGNVERGYPISNALIRILRQKVPGISADWLLFGDPSGLSLKMAGLLGELEGPRQDHGGGKGGLQQDDPRRPEAREKVK